MRRNSIPNGDYPNFSGVVRRMVSLPRDILGEVSRAVGNGIDLMGIGERRTPIFSPPQSPVYPPSYMPQTPVINDEWAFLNSFEQNYGSRHPFFYACRFIQALKIAQDEKKLLFLYLHSPNPFAAEFCRETLCCEVVVEFLDANFVSWGGIADRGEGLQMNGLLKPSGFPFCAVIAPSSHGDIAVLQQTEGPVSPVDFLEILQLTLDEQGVTYGSARAKEEEKRRADRQLREEQDIAYLQALTLDQERESLKELHYEESVEKPVAPSATLNIGHSESQRHGHGLIRRTQSQVGTSKTDSEPRRSGLKENQVTQILLRFPNGERKEHSFSPTDTVGGIYEYIDSLRFPGIENYRLISSFPRKVYGTDEMGMTLKDVGLHPRASLFVEIL